MAKKNPLLLIAILAVIFTSCLESGKNGGYDYSMSGIDFAKITSYSDTQVFMNVEATTTQSYDLMAEINGKFDKADYPVGSRVLISYNFNSADISDKYSRVTLTSVRPVTMVPVDYATGSLIDMDYTPITISKLYKAGNFINIIASVNEAKNRTWTCYLDTNASSPDVAHVYLVTKAEEESMTGATTALSINTASLQTYANVIVHVNCQYGTSHTFELTMIE